MCTKDSQYEKKGKRYRLLQSKCYKKGVVDKMQKAKQVKAKVNLLIQSCWLPA